EPAILAVVDGLSARMGILRSAIQEEIKGIVRLYGTNCNVGPREALLDVWCAACAETYQRTLTGSNGVPESAVLLAVLCKFAAQEGLNQESLFQSCPTLQGVSVRGVRIDAQSSRPPCQRELGRQHRHESTNALHLLSQVLAQPALQAW